MCFLKNYIASMNDSGLLKDLLEKIDDQKSLLYAACCFVLVNIAVGLINFWGQRNLKKMEINVHKANIRETKKIEIFHELYIKLDKLRLIYGNSQHLQNDLSMINNFTNENALYFSSDELKIIEDYCDYFTKLLVSIRHKDVATEKMFMDKLKKEFNK